MKVAGSREPSFCRKDLLPVLKLTQRCSVAALIQRDIVDESQLIQSTQRVIWSHVAIVQCSYVTFSKQAEEASGNHFRSPQTWLGWEPIDEPGR